MSKEKDNIPQADKLMGSMRHMGYSFESAVADVIDNCISASCKNVHLLFPSDPSEPLCMGILDDGFGMSDETLFESMRYGCTSSEEERAMEDLGRFGLGMKSASLSQCRVLTVVSIFKGKTSAYTWDYNLILKKKKWVLLELTPLEIDSLPYITQLKEQKRGTLVLWSDFDVLSNSSDGQVYYALRDLCKSLEDYISLIFHRYMSSKTRKISIYINNFKLKPLDPFLEDHQKTTTKPERTIALPDSKGKERLIHVKTFVLPFISDLSDKDKRLVGGIENLRQRQGFYVYRNQRLIIWGTWFNMKPRAELTKNARVRVDIPNSLDDIWSIDIKKQTATIPKRIQNQLRQTVMDALEISTRQQTHRGRRESVNDNVEYVWERMRGRNDHFYYQINREGNLYQMVRNKMTDEDASYFDMFLKEVERNFPIQQMYVDKSNECIDIVESEDRIGELYELGITMVANITKQFEKPYEEVVQLVMKMEQFSSHPELEKKIVDYFSHEH